MNTITTMIKPILLHGDPLLKEKSGKIPKDIPIAELNALIEDMYQTMKAANGIGLSAIQIGIPLKVFVIEAHIEEENFHFKGFFINPKILNSYGPMVKHPEGCLSVPQLTALVERRENIEMEYYDLGFNKITKIFSGYESRIIQHEYDHLEGILYTDLLDKMWKKALERPLQLIAERKIEVKYLSK